MDRPEVYPRLLAEAVVAFEVAGPETRLERRPADDPFALACRAIERAFIGALHGLRRGELGPPGPVQDLVAYACEVLQHNHVAVAVGPSVEGVAFSAMVREGSRLEAIVFLPPDWIVRLEQDPTMALGGIVMACSHVADFYNGQYAADDLTPIDQRGDAYEAELFRHLVSIGLKPNAYQAALLAKCPAWDPSLAYERRPVEVTN